MVRPQSKAGYRDAKRNLTKLKHLNSFNQKIREILITALKNEDNNSPKKTITFNASSKELWREYSQNIENEMRTNGVYEHYRDHASKLMDNITRIAGIVEFFEGKNEEISIETLKFSYSLCMRYSKHFLTYLAGEPTVVVNANSLVQFLMKKYDKDNDALEPFEFENCMIRGGRSMNFDLTLIKQYGPNALRNTKDDYAALKNAIELLIRIGHVKKIRSQYDGLIYNFKESLVFSAFSRDKLEEPALKNGNEYTIESLPLFDDLVVYHEKLSEERNLFNNRFLSETTYYAIKV